MLSSVEMSTVPVVIPVLTENSLLANTEHKRACSFRPSHILPLDKCTCTQNAYFTCLQKITLPHGLVSDLYRLNFTEMVVLGFFKYLQL